MAGSVHYGAGLGFSNPSPIGPPMKIRFPINCPIAIATMLVCAGLPATAVDVNSITELEARFAQPGAEYSTAPLMVWNGEVTAAAIDRQLTDYKAQSVEAFFIHPRPGLITEYLSDRWVELVRHTMEKARALGMKVWLYDENSYPSGFAGGHVPDQMPESWNQGQGLRPKPLDRAPAAGQCIVLLQKSGGGYIDVTGKVRAGEAGEFICYEVTFYDKRAWHGGFSYVDLIKPGVTEKFIEITMGSYEKAAGKDFGGLVPGMFTDEPNIRAPDRNSMRWTPDLFEQFAKRWGYDLKPNLPSLFEDTGDYRRVRHNYYGLLLDLFIERWSKPWAAYAQKHNLSWTGHYWEHGWPSPGHGPDNMAMYAWHDIPGIDMLFNQFDEGVNAQFGNVRSVKELSSVANQMGRRRALCETYGGAGWELRFEDMKRLGDWQAVLGVNFQNQHLSHQTLLGSRKHDYPQSFTYHTPWWPQYGVLGRYFARLSMALATGEQVNRVLVLEPSTSAWMHASIPKAGPGMMEIGRSFQAFVTALEYAQVEFDLGSENIMRDHGESVKGGLRVGKRVYDVVVLPPGTESLDRPTATLLTAYVKAGGKVISMAAPPSWVDGRASDEMAKLASAYGSQWQRAATPDDALKLLPASGVRVTQGKLMHQRRKLTEGEILFFANSNLSEGAKASVQVSGAAVTRLNAVDGTFVQYAARHVSGKTEFDVDLAPGGSLLIYHGPAVTGAAAPKPGPAAKTPIAPASPLSVSRLAPNALRIDYLDLDAGGESMKDIYYFVAQEAAYQKNGLPANPWDRAVQFKRTTLEQDKFPAGSGFTATFRFTLAPGISRNGLRTVVERPAMYRVSVNGKPVEPIKGEWWLDVDFGVFDIGPHVQDGENTISLTISPMSIHAELEPIHITGDFGVEAAGRGWRIVPSQPLTTGEWVAQKLPFYSDRVVYAADYTLASGLRHFVRFAEWHGTVAEVRVNGKSAGVIGWQPYEIEITPLVKAGKNRVEVIVTGSLKNLLGPHHGKINRGLVSPGSFRNAPPQQPAGAAYDLDRYGLMQGFEVLTARK